MRAPQQPGRLVLAWRRTFVGLSVFALFAGMLFWTKLRLVGDIPRSAYAVPEREADEPPATLESERNVPDPAD